MSKNKKKKSARSQSKTQATPPAKTKVEVPEVKGNKSPFWSDHRLHLILVFLVSCGLYMNTLGHQYAVDDSIVILRNAYTKKGFKGMKGIWSEDTFAGFFGGKRNLVAGGRYRPFSVATFALELQLFGKKELNAQGQPVLDKDGDVVYQGNPFVSHFFNVLLYGFLCMVLYLVLLQLFNPTRDQAQVKGYFIALMAALLYAAHPLHTEAVANIKGRDEILVLLGSLLALYGVLKAATKETVREMPYLIGAGIAYTIAIFSKESAVTFLAIIPGALYVFTTKKLDYITMRTLPFFAIFLAFFVVRFAVLGDAGSLVGKQNQPTVELMNDPFLKYQPGTSPINGTYIPFTTEERMATLFYTWGKYVNVLVYPKTLTNDYYPKHIRTDQDEIPSFRMPMVLGSFLLHLALGILMVLGLLRRRAWGFFILFYWATFSVVSNLIFPIGTNMAERFMFLPSVGFSGLCALGLYHLSQRLKKTNQSHTETFRVPTILALIVLSLYAAKTFNRNKAWYDDYTLFTTDIAYSPHSAKLNNAVSGVLQASVPKIKDVYQRTAVLEEARQRSIAATTLHPRYNSAWLLQGNANVMLGENYLQRGELTTDQTQKNQLIGESLKHSNEAIVAYEYVLQLKPSHPDVRQNMGVAYQNRGKVLGQYYGDLTNSIASLEKAIEFSPDNPEALRLIGVAYGIRGQRLETQGQTQAGYSSHLKAKESFERLVELQPENVSGLYNLSLAYRSIGDVARAEEMQRRWMAIDPNYDPTK